MGNLVEELQERFGEGLICYASLADGPTFREYAEEEGKMVDLFSGLFESVDTIPADVLREAEDLRVRLPKSFGEILEALIEGVGGKYESGGYFEPASAGEFVGKLIEYVKLREPNPHLSVRSDAVS